MSLTAYRRLFSTAFLSLLLVAFCSTCATKEIVPEPAEPVKAFFAELIQIVEQNSINRRTIDWADYKAKVWAKVGNAKTVPETEPAMVLAMALLKDNHSSIIVDNKRGLYGGVGCGSLPAATPFTFAEPNIGYVKVDGFSGSSQEGISFAQAIQNEIARQDDKNLKGWIVDLRRNTGGNMYPMIAGLGPLLGEGVCGGFFDIDDKLTGSFSYRQGGALLNQTVLAQVERPYQLSKSNPKVAVLISGATASSGEAAAIAFSGRPNTRFLGSATCGISTGNQMYTLPFYGYTLNLFTVRIGDRTGKVYGKELIPDELVSTEQTIARAVKWLNE
ncbi:S41 family peptidase [Rudanella lutea]|uniref:S41 family peptidase n=1 Tax=Rudanella lutea TaxID=451374 RepID=UPI00037E7F4B|nr:S41 family peptidase [Rudanella lutea]